MALPRTIIIAVVVTLLAPSVGLAQDKREDLLQLLKSRPRGMSRDTWREQRREAARELGRFKERRAVPTLLQIIKRERFDVILEIAIDALGEIGDPRAVGPLKNLLKDPSLDAYVRDAAASAMRKLSGDKSRPTPRQPRVSKPDPLPPVEDVSTPIVRGSFAKLPALSLPELGVDTIARSTQLELVAGSGHFDYNGNAKIISTALSLRSHYFRQLERKTLGYSIDSAADVRFDLLDPPVGDATWAIGHDLQINPEVRYYPFTNDLPQLFGQLSAGVGYGLAVAAAPLSTESRVTLGATVTAAGGPGYGRIVDVGPRLRLSRIARVLEKSGVLAAEIDSAIGTKLIQTWYELRNRIGSFSRLGYTLKVLNEAHLLKEEIDAATAYRIIRILDDPQLDQRRSGLMLRLGYGYARQLLKDADDRTLAFLYATAEVQRQHGTSRALGAGMRFYYNMWGTPDTYGIDITGHYDWYLYNRAFDPLGAIGLGLDAGLNNQPGDAFEDGGIAYRVLAAASYSRFFSRGTRIVSRLRGGIQDGGAVVLVSIEAQYGIASGSFIGAP